MCRLTFLLQIQVFQQKDMQHHDLENPSPSQKINYLVVEPTHLKNMLVKLDHFPK